MLYNFKSFPLPPYFQQNLLNSWILDNISIYPRPRLYNFKEFPPTPLFSGSGGGGIKSFFIRITYKFIYFDAISIGLIADCTNVQLD